MPLASATSSTLKWLEKEILSAAKPVAIFTANGAHALEVLEVCESAGIRIPDDVAIIG